MNLLAIETSQSAGSLAVLADGDLLAELPLPQDRRSTQSLAPGLKAILAQVGWKPRDVVLVAVAVGPGSFTGLRVGVTAAKAFAYSVGAEVLGVDTLEAIAAAVPPEVPRLAAAMDAQRGEVVAGTFVRGEQGWFVPEGPAKLLELKTWLDSLPAGTHVASPLLGRISSQLPPRLLPVDPRFWFPTAASVGRLAARRYAAGERDDLWTLVPHYSRPSAAEEKWASRKRDEQRDDS